MSELYAIGEDGKVLVRWKLGAPVIKVMSDIGRTIVGSSSWRKNTKSCPVRHMIDMEMRMQNDCSHSSSFTFSEASQEARAWAFDSQRFDFTDNFSKFIRFESFLRLAG